MKKRLLLLLALIVGLLALAVPTVVFAHNQALSPTTFYACEALATVDGTGTQAGQIDGTSITQDDQLQCPVQGGNQDATTQVHWSVTGPQGPAGQDGTNGTNGTDGAQGPIGPAGPKGDTGPAGTAGIPFTHAACANAPGLTGSQVQENMVFCISGILDETSPVYTAAINAAAKRVLVGTPLSTTGSVDWNNQPITYVEFTSAYHAEYHTTGDTTVRIYNALNQRVF